MSKYIVTAILLVTSILSCKNDTSDLTAEQILDKVIEKSGRRALYNATLKFKFLDIDYTTRREGYQYEYEMSRSLDTIEYIARAYNGGFEYKENGQPKDYGFPNLLLEKNLVGLNDFMILPANFENDNSIIVNKKNNVVIRDNTYLALNIFLSAKLPSDPTTNYNLYINPKNFDVAFIAYDFESTNGRLFLREAVNKRRVDDVYFCDFITYWTKGDDHILDDLPNLYENGEMTEQVTFEPIDITIQPL